MNQNWEAVFYYRLSRQIFLSDPYNEMLPYLASLMKYKTGAELYYSTNIGSRFMLMHGSGVVVGPNCTIGNECLIYQGVTIGQQHNFSPNENAVIGNKVKLFTGAKILGKVSIGDDVIVGANAVVTKDLHAKGVYIGAPARKIRTVEESALPDL
jgi:serine O-acetyltransferase